MGCLRNRLNNFDQIKALLHILPTHPKEHQGVFKTSVSDGGQRNYECIRAKPVHHHVTKMADSRGRYYYVNYSDQGDSRAENTANS